MFKNYSIWLFLCYYLSTGYMDCQAFVKWCKQCKGIIAMCLSCLSQQSSLNIEFVLKLSVLLKTHKNWLLYVWYSCPRSSDIYLYKYSELEVKNVLLVLIINPEIFFWIYNYTFDFNLCSIEHNVEKSIGFSSPTTRILHL